MHCFSKGLAYRSLGYFEFGNLVLTKLSVILSRRRSTTVSLETYPLYFELDPLSFFEAFLWTLISGHLLTK